MAMTTAQKTDAYRFFAIAFDAAPGATYLSQIQDAYAAGMTTKQIVNVYTTKSAFTDIYPTSLSATEFATKLVNAVVDITASPSAKEQAVTDIAAAIASGYSRGDVIYQVFSNLAKMPQTDPVWGGTAILMAKQVTVAQYFSENLGVASTDPLILRAALAEVTLSTDVSSTERIDQLLAPSHVFTLTESSTTVVSTHTTAAVTHTEVYWGYNPHLHGETGVDNLAGGNTNNLTNEGAQDGGVPVEYLYEYLTTVTGLTFAQLGLINVANGETTGESTQLFPTVAPGIDVVQNDNGTVAISVTQSDGTIHTSEVALGAMYFQLLHDALFDAEGNSRLFEKVIVDHAATTSGSSVTTLKPIILTPFVNNYNPTFDGYTTSGSDVIVAGRLELLHQAYIDAGVSLNPNVYNVLEVDAKGTYAQPAALLNIQEVRINDLPNPYTTDYYDGAGNLQNTLYNDAGFLDPNGTGSDDSWLDLSRATSIKKLVISDSGNGSGDASSGNLTVVGVRNGATLRLEGGFNSGDTNIQYGIGQTGVLNLELAVGDVNTSINLLQNAAVLNIDSQGVVNHLHSFFGGGSISRMIIKGAGEFAVEEDLSSSFNAVNPIIIDASANTGGLNINFDGDSERFASITVKGTTNNDEITVTNVTAYGPGSTSANNGALFDSNGGKVTIDAGNGDNTVVTTGSSIVKVTTGTGDDTIFASFGEVVTIVAGDGSNVIRADDSGAVTITSGVGEDNISAQGADFATIVAGDGNNMINTDGSAVVKVTSGAGNDSISSVGSTSVTIDAGAGNNTIGASATSSINITTGAGNDSITAKGAAITINSAGGTDTIRLGGTYASEGLETPANGSLLNVNTGTTGSATIYFGNDQSGASPAWTQELKGVTALDGSVIAGANVKFYVDSPTNLTQADLSGLTGSTKFVVEAGDALRITSDQFKTLGTAAFSEHLAGAGAQTGDIYIVVAAGKAFDLSAMDLSGLSPNVKLHFELQEAANLTLTAAQLHNYLANDAVTSVTGTNGAAAASPNGIVTLTGVGSTFDWTLDGDDDRIFGTISDAKVDNLVVNRDATGFNRPTDAVTTDVYTIDSNGSSTLVVSSAIITEAQTLKIVGNQAVTFTAKVDLGADASESTPSLGIYKDDVASSNAETDAFTVDFSGVTGKVSGLTLDHFQDVKSIKGNGVAGTRIDVILNADVGSVGVNKGLNTTGVETYMVTRIDTNQDGLVTSGDAATINLCDLTQGVKYIGLKGNGATGAVATLTLNDVPWGVAAPHIVLEGDGVANASDALKINGSPNTSNVGNVTASFNSSKAVAVVDINNGGVTLGTPASGTERKLSTGTITLTNAASATFNVTDGDATIAAVAGATLTSVKFVAVEDVTLTGALLVGLTTINAAGVVGAFTATMGAQTDKFALTGGTGGVKLTLTGLVIDDVTGQTNNGSTIDGGAAGADLSITKETTSDIAHAVLTNVNKVTLGNLSELTLSLDQVTAIAIADISVAKPGYETAKLNVEGVGNVAFDATAFNDGVAINNVTIAADDEVTLAATTDLTGVHSLIVPEGTVLNLTAAQFQELEGAGTITGDGVVNITGLTQADLEDGIDFSGIANGGTITLAGSVSFASSDDLGNFGEIALTSGQTVAMFLDQANELDVTGGLGTTLQILDTSVGPFDTIDASGFDVAVLKVLNVMLNSVNGELTFAGLPGSVLLEIYNSGFVEAVERKIAIDAGTTVPGFLVFNDHSDDSEVTTLSLTMNGGVEIQGNLRLSTYDKAAELVSAHFSTLTITSTGTASNLISSEKTNVIDGTITPFGLIGGSLDNNLKNVVINATTDLNITGGIVFSSLNDGLDYTTADSTATATVTVTGSADVQLGLLDTSDTDVDALNVVNNGTGTVSLTLNSDSNGDDLSFTGGDIVLTIADDGGIIDLSEADLAGVVSIVLEDGAELSLTLQQMYDIGADNITVVTGGDADLNLTGLDSNPFALADFNDGVTVHVVGIAPLPVVTLDEDTDLTGITGLAVPEGTVLNLTAAQFQQLTGAGTITGDGTVNITDLSPADLEDGINLSGISVAHIGTITLAESVSLASTDSLGEFTDITLTTGQTLGLFMAQADELQVTGASNTAIKILDTALNSGDAIDASGFDVTTVKLLGIAVAGENIDQLLGGLQSGVIKQIYNEFGWTGMIDQVVTVDAGVTVDGGLAFVPTTDDTELRTFTLNLSGGAEILGDLDLSTTPKMDGAGTDLLRNHLQTLTINSIGDAENLLDGHTANLIDGDISATNGTDAGGFNNNLLNVVITAAQELEVTGSIVFSSVVGDDVYTGNDNEEAVATLTINGTNDVSLGGLNTDDEDVVGLDVINNSTGTLSATLNANDIDASDALSFTGSGDIALTVNGMIDLSDDELTAVSEITLTDLSILTLTQAQLDAVGVADFAVPDAEGGDEATINIVDLGSSVFNATALGDGLIIGTVTLAEGAIHLHANTNLTNVVEIIVPEGSTLWLTAAQYQQLEGAGTITGVDSDGNISSDFTVHITDLTQDDVALDVNGDDDYADAADYTFDLSGIDADHVDVSLKDATVTMGVFDDVGALIGASEADLADASFILAAGQTLGLVSATQADGREVTGLANSTVDFTFAWADFSLSGIDASGFDVTTLKVLDTFVNNLDVENLLEGLASDVILRVYQTLDEMGYVTPINRQVFIEHSVTVDGFMVFNTWQDDHEVRSVTLTMDGGVEINGNLRLSTTDKTSSGLQAVNFQTLNIVSQGTLANTLTGDFENVIDGNITPVGTVGPAINNNLLNVNINATQDFILTGDILFNSIDTDFLDAHLTVTGTADVTVHSLNTADSDEALDSLTITNSGSGTLTITDVGVAALNVDNTEEVDFAGAGDIVLGTELDWGVEGDTLSVIDASAMSGDLTLSNVTDIDNADFVFTAGGGVTTMTLTDINLDSTGVDGTAGTDDDTTGWTFDFSDAKVGSEFHLDGAMSGIAAGNILNIDMGAHATLFIDQDMDLSDLDLSILQTLPIVLAAGVTLTLTAAQASGLTIVAAPGIVLDPDALDYVPLDVPVVNIVELGDAAVDLGGVNHWIAGTVTLADDDVTLALLTDLGDFTVELEAKDDTAGELIGQTIRFSTVEQADNAVSVVDNVAGDGTNGGGSDMDTAPNSTNVVWNFKNISAPVDTSGYSDHLGRLWFSADLVTNEGGLVESLFTTLPDSVLRIDFTSFADLDAALADSTPVNRTIELVAFTDVSATGLTFSDTDRLEHIQTLRIDMGGEVNLGDLKIDNVVSPSAGVDLTSIHFDSLVINSMLADHLPHYLAPEGWDPALHVAPDNLNTIGDISVGSVNGIDLISVTLNATEANIAVGKIIFDRAVAGSVTLNVTGHGDVTIETLDTTDPQITTLTINDTGTGNLEVTGGSPALALGGLTDNTETLVISGSGAGNIAFGTGVDGLGDPFAGVSGAELSVVNISTEKAVDLGVVALIDSALFTLTDSNDTAATTLTLGQANVNGVLTAPTLAAGGTWIFGGGAGDLELTITGDVTLGAGNLVIDTTGHTLFIDGNVDFTTLKADPNFVIGASQDDDHQGLDIVSTETIVLKDGATLQMTDEQWSKEFGDLTFEDEAGDPPVLHVTAALLLALGGDLTLVRGYSAYEIDFGLAVTLRPDQALVASVYDVAGDLGDAGALGDADVTVFVHDYNPETNGEFAGDVVDLTGLTGIGAIDMEDTDENANTVDFTVEVTVQEANDLVGDVTRNGNTLTALAGDTNENGNSDGNLMDLTDPTLDLSEVDVLLLQDPDGTIINLDEWNSLRLDGNGNINIVEEDGNGNNDLVLIADGVLTPEMLDQLDALIITGDTTITAQQAAHMEYIIQDDPLADYTLTVNAMEAGYLLADTNGYGVDANGNSFSTWDGNDAISNNPPQLADDNTAMAFININANNTRVHFNNLQHQDGNPDNGSEGVSNIVMHVDTTPFDASVYDSNTDSNIDYHVTSLILLSNIGDTDVLSADGTGTLVLTGEDQIDGRELTGTAHIRLSTSFDHALDGNSNWINNEHIDYHDFSVTYTGSGSLTLGSEHDNAYWNVDGNAVLDAADATGDVTLWVDLDWNGNANDSFTMLGSSGKNVVYIDENSAGDAFAAGVTVDIAAGAGTEDELVIFDDYDVNENTAPFYTGFETLVIANIDFDQSYDLEFATQFTNLLIRSAEDQNYYADDNNIVITGLSAVMADHITIGYEDGGDDNMMNDLTISLLDSNGNADSVTINLVMDANQFDYNQYVGGDLTIDGVESITFNSTGDANYTDINGNTTVMDNAIENLYADVLQTLTITGDVSFQIDNNLNAPNLSLIDANSFTGDWIELQDVDSNVRIEYQGADSAADQNIDIRTNDADITVGTGGGDDYVNVGVYNDSVTSDIIVSTGGGDDYVTVWDDNFNTDVNIHTGEGSDNVILWDTRDAVVHLGGGDDWLVAFETMGNVIVHGDAGDDVIVLDMDDANSFSVFLGTGHDAVFAFDINDNNQAAIEIHDFNVAEDKLVLESYQWQIGFAPDVFIQGYDSNNLVDYTWSVDSNGNPNTFSDINLDSNGNYHFSSNVVFESTTFQDGSYSVASMVDANETLVLEFAFVADGDLGSLNAPFDFAAEYSVGNLDGNMLLESVSDSNNPTLISVDADTSGYLIAYEGGDAYVFAYHDGGSGTLDGSEIWLVGVLDGIAMGALGLSNFDFMLVPPGV